MEIENIEHLIEIINRKLKASQELLAIEEESERPSSLKIKQREIRIEKLEAMKQVAEFSIGGNFMWSTWI